MTASKGRTGLWIITLWATPKPLTRHWVCLTQPYGRAFPLTTISGFEPLNQQNGSGPVFTDPHNFQALDNVSWTKGSHQFRFGFETHWIRFRGTGGGGPGPAVKGILTFGSTAAFTGATPLESFLAGKITTASVQIGPIVRQISQHYYAGFVQDDWRITPRLTLNAGVRYEVQTPYRDANSLIGNFDPTAPSGIMQQDLSVTGAIVRRNIYKTDMNNVSPRLGAAWDITGKGTTVIRAAGSILYSATNFSPFSEVQTAPSGATFYNPNGSTFTVPGGTNITAIVSDNGTLATFQPDVSPFAFSGANATPRCGNGQGSTLTFTPDPDGAGPLLGSWAATGAANPSPCSLTAVDPNLYTPYVTNWSLSFQQAFGTHVSLDLAYVGNHATGLRSYSDVNQPNPGVKSTGNALQNRRPFTTNCAAIPAVPNGTVIAPTLPANAVIGGAGTSQYGGGCFPWLSTVNYIANTRYGQLQLLPGWRAHAELSWSLNRRRLHLPAAVAAI